MRRDSQLALALESALSARGVRVPPRRLERWSADGLGPLAAASFDDHVAHYAAVATLSASGRDVDVVALRLGGRGLSCNRLRGALLRRMGIAPGPPEVIPFSVDLSSDASSENEFDPIFVEIEAAALELRSVEPRVPLLQKVLSAMRQNAARHSEALHEEPEDIVHSFFVSIAWHMFGGEAYNVEAWAAVADVDPATVSPELEAFLDAMRPNPAARDDAYRYMPVEQIVEVARWLSAFASDFLLRFGLPALSEEEVGEACCMFAPWATYQMALMAPRLTEMGLDPGHLPSVFREIVEDAGGGERIEAMGIAQPPPRLPDALPKPVPRLGL